MGSSFKSDIHQREYLKANYSRIIDEIKFHHENGAPEVVDTFLRRFEAAPIQEKALLLRELKERTGPKLLHKHERKNLRKI